jgi:opacity protein-like surface antigen
MLCHKLKNLILIIACGMGLMANGASFASSCCDEDESMFDGFYGGGSIGYMASSAHSLYEDDPGIISYHMNTYIGVRGFDGGIHAGWGTTWRGCGLGPWYLGIEGAALAAHARGRDYSESLDGFLHHQRAALRNSFQLAARFGIPLSNVLPYIKIGWNCAKWELEHEQTPFLTAGSSTVVERDKYLNAILWAIGIDFKTNYCSNLIWGLEWTYSEFKRQILDLDSDLNPAAELKIRPSYSRIALRLSYHF